MKRISVLILFLSTQMVFGQGIEFFNGTWKEALEKAKQEDKLVFIDAYATWCGPCKRMAKTVFTQNEVGEFFNKTFINLKLDMEKSDGLSFGKKYPVSAYPTLFFLDGNGKIIKKVTGGQNVTGLINAGKSAYRSNDTSGDFAKLYEEGNRDYDLMYSYVKALNRVGKPSLKISNEYLKSNPKITADQKAAFLLIAVVDADSKLFDQLLMLKKEAIKSSSEDAFTAKVYSACFNTIKKSVEFEYPALFDQALEKYKRADVADYGKFEQEAQLEYYKLNGDYDAWKRVSEKYLKKHGKKNTRAYLEHAAILKNDFKYEEDAINYALTVNKELLKRDDSSSNYNNVIQLLITTKNYEEALKLVNEAIEKAKKRDENTANFERMKEYLNTL